LPPRESLVSKLGRQSSPKRCNHRLILGLAALRTLQNDRLFILIVFHLSGDGPFNHEGVALLTQHGSLPTDKDFNRKRLTPGRVSVLRRFHVAFRILFKLLLALNSTYVKRVGLIGGCCGGMLRLISIPQMGSRTEESGVP
jgi:hypothetical protein